MTARTRRIALRVLAFAGLILVGFWFSATRARRANERAIVAIESERTSLAASLLTLHARVESAEKAQRPVADAATRRTAESAAAGKKTDAPRIRTMSEIIADSPALELLELERQRAATNQEYDRLFRRLKLTPEQVAAFRELRVRLAETWMDLKAAARTQGIEAEKTTADLQAKATAEHETALVALLGPEGFRQFQEFSSAIPVHNVVVRGLAGAAALEGVPLSPGQSESLLAATMAASRAADSRGEVDLRALDWDALDTEAQRILTPAQFDLFKNVEPPSGFQGHLKHKLDAAIQHAVDADRATAKAAPAEPGR